MPGFLPRPTSVRGDTSVPVLAILAALALPGSGQEVFINELHYDNVGGDIGEFIEIAGPAGTDLAGWSLILYNGNGGAIYGTVGLSGLIDDEGATGFGAVSFPVSGLQNGAPDGIALVRDNAVIQFLSYEGTFTATEGPANGLTSNDIGVAENGNDPVGQSLQLSGTGNRYGDFDWIPPSPESPGSLNGSQTFTGGVGTPSITLAIVPQTLLEDGPPATGTLTLFPAPTAPRAIFLASSDASEAIVPASVLVPVGGSVSFEVTPRDDGVPDGPRQVTISATDPGGTYTAATAAVVVLDNARPQVRGAAIRIAACNTFNGVGTPGSADFLGLRDILARLAPDIIAFSETSDAGDFADLRALVAALGFETTPAHLATRGDAFAANAYSGGDFASGQYLALASRWPILETVQIGRGVAGRREMTRFPLFVRVDVPGTDNDPAIVAVHLKATSDSASLFRKAVEAHRIEEFLLARGYDGTRDNLFVIGDVNEDWDNFQPASVHTGINLANPGFADGSTFPVTYVLGSDLTGFNAITLNTNDFPIPTFARVGIGVLDTRQADRIATRTFLPQGDARLDYILASAFARANGHGPTEIYNSTLDFAFDGLPKAGLPLPGGTSSAVSDHLPVFGDFELDPAPRLALAFSASTLDDRAGPFALTATVSADPPPAPGESLTVTFHQDRPDCLAVPATATLVGPASQVTVPLAFAPRCGVEPDRLWTLSAASEGYSTAHGRLPIRNTDPSGALLFSQYIETSSGSSPKAVEVMNLSGSTVDFAATPLALYTYANGSAFRDRILLLERGLLPAGQVLVIGDVTTGNHLIAQGLLGDPEGELASAEHGSLIPSASTQAVFVKRSFTFNGDDALEIHLGYTRADVFGLPGDSPGAAWTGGGLSTANMNLTLRPDAGTGSAGFPDLAGFGFPPVIDDPYLAWAAVRGLTGLAAAPSGDPDFDGFPTVLEFGLGSDPANGGSVPALEPVMAGAYGALRFRRLVLPGRLVLRVEAAPGLRGWQTTPALFGAPVPNGDGSETVVFRAPLPHSVVPALAFRITAELP